MKISGLFSDGMILQRGKNTLLYGETDINERVAVYFHKEGSSLNDEDLGPEYPAKDLQMYHTKSDENGYFEVELKSRDDDGPFELIVLCNKEKIVVKDILFGDVFLLGGQSNMELTIGMIPDMNEKTLKSANNSDIRMFSVPHEYDFSGKARVLDQTSWKSVSGETIADFSAIGYYFAEEKYKNDGVPVGLIHTAVGGAPIEALMSEANIRKCAEEIRSTGVFASEYDHDKHRGCIHCYEELFEKTKDLDYAKNRVKEDLNRIEKWHKDVDERDLGLSKEWYLKNWEDDITSEAISIDSLTSPEDIMKCNMPGFFKDTVFEDYFGTVWLQKSFYISENHAKYGAKLYLGTLVDFDDAYVNGVKVGHTDYRYPQRRYQINEGVLKPGKNIVTVRLGMDGNVGGFLPDMPYKVSIVADVCSSGCTSHCDTCGGDCNNNAGCRNNRTETIDISLEGSWLIRAGAKADRLDGETFFIWHPSALYNSMIAPLRGYATSAILFYQGESNGFAPEYYDVLFKAMTEEWRSLVGNVPMLYSEVAVYLGDGPVYEADSFEGVREVQRRVESEMNNTFLIPITKLPVPYNELHPQNKADVAHMFYEIYIANR